MIPHDPSTLAYALTRAAHFGACLLLLGVFIFDRLVIAGESDAGQFWQTQWTRIARRLVFLSVFLSLISGVAWLSFISMNLNELAFADACHAGPLKAVLDHSEFGHLWKMRALFWVGGVVMGLAAFAFRNGRPLSTITKWLALFFAIALAVSTARAGHGAEGTRWHQAADAAHLLIGSAWPVGLLPLALLLTSARRMAGLEKWIALLPVIRRFSVLSLISVILISVSGVINSWPLVGTWANLFASAYGRVLLIKVALFGVMIFLGAINMLRLRPRLALDYQSSTDKSRTAVLKRLQWNVWIEIILGIAVLLAAGLLGTLAPACDQCCGAG